MNLVSVNQNKIDRNSVQFLEWPLSHGLNPVCFVPSRIADTSFSLFDIFPPYSAVTTYVIPEDLFDHCIIMNDFLLYFAWNKNKSNKA